MMKFSFSLVLRLVMLPVTLGLMLMGDTMLERITGLLMLATLESVTVGLPVMVVIALMLIWKKMIVRVGAGVRLTDSPGLKY